MENKIYIDKVISEKQEYSVFLPELKKIDLEEVHVLAKPLLIKDDVICTGAGIAIIQKGKKILFVKNPSSTPEEYEDFTFDFKQLIAELIGKYEYRALLGAPNRIHKDLTTFYITDDINYIELLSDECLLLEGKEFEYAEIMSSLIKGSINDHDRIENLLQADDFISKAKNRIISFDTNQTRFIFPTTDDKTHNKKEAVQGMAGSGKTEMLLHRLRTIYMDTLDNPGVKIAFTCHNKVLANELRTNKINSFFNSMKFDKQILWDEKLFCFGAWGSQSRQLSGMYAYICKYYDAPFYNYTEVKSFTTACQLTLEHLKKYKIDTFAFQYVLIDESQDLPDEFFELCELITETKVYVAGDVYQDIFDTNSKISLKPDFLLNRVYRTDSKTFMFAHLFALGYFDKKIKWLEVEDMKLCGYTCEESKNSLRISREPLRWNENKIELKENAYECNNNAKDSSIENIITQIKELKKAHEGELVGSDIAIVILSKYTKFQSYANDLSHLINTEVGLNTIISSENNQLLDEAVYISNQNQIKGLEFPFVFVLYDESDFSPGTKQFIKLRTAFYMAATRSLIKTFIQFIDEKNFDLINKYSSSILADGYIDIQTPTEEEIKELNEEFEKIQYNKKIVPTRDGVEKIARKYLINSNIILNGDDMEDLISAVTKNVQKMETSYTEDEYNQFVISKTKQFIAFLQND